jgi:hypothetical protein
MWVPWGCWVTHDESPPSCYARWWTGCGHPSGCVHPCQLDCPQAPCEPAHTHTHSKQGSRLIRVWHYHKSHEPGTSRIHSPRANPLVQVTAYSRADCSTALLFFIFFHSFFINLIMLSKTQDYIVSNGRISEWIMNWKGYEKQSWCNLRYYPTICLEVQKKNIKISDSQSSGWNLDSGLPEYEAECLPPICWSLLPYPFIMEPNPHKWWCSVFSE